MKYIMKNRQKTEPIRIILADDHDIYREGFKTVLKNQDRVEIIGEASHGKELVNLVVQLQPDIVLTDIYMPEMDGLEATRIIRQTFPEVGVIALSLNSEYNLVFAMLEAGAKGFLPKNAKKEEIIYAISKVYQKEMYYSNSSTSLIQLITKSHPRPKIKLQLSKKEEKIMQLICREFSNKEIAVKLNITTRSVESTRERILAKIGAKNMAGIVVYAIKNGIFNLD
jgi:DNA-binding NarL/FixJ family response regulator